MKKSPNRSVMLMANLALKLHRRETFLCGGKHEHGHEPIHKRKLGTVHHSVGTKTLPVMAALAFVTLLIALPIMDYTSAYGTYDTDLISVSLPCCLAALFVGVLLHKTNYLHNVVLLVTKANLAFACANPRHIYIFR